MNTPQLLIGFSALVVSALPLFWMALLAVTQVWNLWLSPPHIREFLAITAFWVGAAGSFIFFIRCCKRGLKPALSPFVIAAIGIGCVGGLAEEIMLAKNQKASFPIGFFELCLLAWVIAGVAGARFRQSTSHEHEAVKPDA